VNVKHTIEKLKQAGLTVHMRHERPILVPVASTRKFDMIEGEDIGFGTRHELEQIREQAPGAYFGLKGGATTVEISFDGRLIGRGTAYCRPDDEKGPGDQFDRKLGALIALGRAVKQDEYVQEVLAS
jgi:hypothetical protein